MTTTDDVSTAAVPPLPPYVYGRECGPNEKVWREDAVRAFADARVAADRAARASEALRCDECVNHFVCSNCGKRTNEIATPEGAAVALTSLESTLEDATPVATGNASQAKPVSAGFTRWLSDGGVVLDDDAPAEPPMDEPLVGRPE